MGNDVTPPKTQLVSKSSSDDDVNQSPHAHIALATPTASFSTLSKSISSVNGIVGKHISYRLSRIVCIFWCENIETLSMPDQLELSCAIFFSMLASGDEMKKVMNQSFNNNLKIETISLKYLDMVGWLIRNLLNDGIDLHLSLTKLGTLHNKMAIKHIHFLPMIQSMHEILSYYYPKKYSISVQYAMEAVMVTAAEIMTGKDINRSKSICGSSTYFLQSLEVCLSSPLGLEYFNRYLRIRQNEEITIYLQLMQKFKNQTNNKERYCVAKDIIRKCVETNGSFAVNISYECRKQTIEAMKTFGKSGKTTVISNNFFEQLEMEMRRLIIKNHWRGFVRCISPLHNSTDFNLSTIDVNF